DLHAVARGHGEHLGQLRAAQQLVEHLAEVVGADGDPLERAHGRTVVRDPDCEQVHDQTTIPETGSDANGSRPGALVPLAVPASTAPPAVPLAVSPAPVETFEAEPFAGAPFAAEPFAAEPFAAGRFAGVRLAGAAGPPPSAAAAAASGSGRSAAAAAAPSVAAPSVAAPSAPSCRRRAMWNDRICISTARSTLRTSTFS